MADNDDTQPEPEEDVQLETEHDDATSEDDSGATEDELRAEARKHRKGKAAEKARADQLQQQLDALQPVIDQMTAVQKALGLGGEESDDDTSQDAASEVERLQGELRRERTSRRVENLAASSGADGELVSAYLSSSGKLDGIDPDDNDRLSALVAAAIEAKPALVNAEPKERTKTAGDLDDTAGDDLESLDMQSFIERRGRTRALKRR